MNVDLTAVRRFIRAEGPDQYGDTDTLFHADVVHSDLDKRQERIQESHYQSLPENRRYFRG